MTFHIPLSLKMSATWENEKLSSSIVPRICNLNITQVIFDRLIEDKVDNNHNNFFVSIRMRDNSRRVLRSPELIFPTTAPGTVQLDFNCSIQYSHALKRDSSNLLQLLIQRRKKYKKKSVNLGYKTLAYCTIDLAQVLQRKIDNKFLDLYDDPKSMANQIARIEVQSLTTCPAEKDMISDRRKEFYEEEDEGMHEQFSEPEDSDRADDSDYDQNCVEDTESGSRQKKIMKAMSIGISGHHRHRRSSSPSTTLPEWQKQIKQKIMGLLKKVKLMEHSEVLDPRDTCQLWDEIDQLENVSEDSDIGDMDTLSIQSTPRPTLRPFFGHYGVPNHTRTEGSEDTLSADAGTKLLKKLQLENPGQCQSSNVGTNNISEIVTSTGDKSRTNDGSETTEDESKSFTHVKKHSYSHEKDGGSASQSIVGKNKSKSKNSNPLTSTTQTKKEQQKPKKPISGIMKTFSFSTAAPTISSSTITATTGSNKLNQWESNSSDAQNLAAAPSTNYSISPGTSLTTSNTILTPLTSEAVNDYSSDIKLSIDNNNIQNTRRGRQRSSSIPHSMSMAAFTRNYESDSSCCNNEKLITKFLNKSKLSAEPRIELVEQVNEFMTTHNGSMEVVYLINLSDFGGKQVMDLFTKENIANIAVASFADVKFTMTQIVNRIRKKPDIIKICLLGGDSHLSSVLRVFVDQMNLNYSKEIVSCFRFFLIPITGFSISSSSISASPFINQATTINNSMSRRLCSIDSKYASLFAEFIQLENISSSYSIVERNNKFLFGVHDYLQASGTLQCPIGDCLVACCVKQQNLTQDCDSSTESFIPFVCEVRLGETTDIVFNKTEGSLDDQWLNSTSSSPPRSPVIGNVETNIKGPFVITSPVSISTAMPYSTNIQNVVAPTQPNNQSSYTIVPANDTSLELQLEYWTDHSAKKVSLKSAFRQILVSPIISNNFSLNTQHLLSLTIISREKKQKIMRIAKKTKHDAGDSKKETFDDVNRILCTSKSQNSAIRVTIDGVNWTGVKFFQLSPYWRTQIKTFPIATFNS